MPPIVPHDPPFQIRQVSGDPSAVAPPVPIPNTEVKRCSPDGSASIGRARVGRCQSYAPLPEKQEAGLFFAGGSSGGRLVFNSRLTQILRRFLRSRNWIEPDPELRSWRPFWRAAGFDYSFT